MSRRFCLTLIIAMVLTVFLVGTQLGCGDKPEKKAAEKAEEAEAAPEKMEMPFGGAKDVEFANAAWATMKGYQDAPMKTEMIPGKSPHGAFITIYYDVVNVQGKPYHTIIKDNFTPEKELAAITVMVQREAGYDADNNDWFWVKYDPDGTVGKNDKDMALAGRVAKGMEQGCIACHKAAGGEDYIFINDTEM
ncbi:cytochrome P460 family protein [Candidatus Poribacteria bacterium]